MSNTQTKDDTTKGDFPNGSEGRLNALERRVDRLEVPILKRPSFLGGAATILLIAILYLVDSYSSNQLLVRLVHSLLGTETALVHSIKDPSSQLGSELSNTLARILHDKPIIAFHASGRLGDETKNIVFIPKPECQRLFSNASDENTSWANAVGAENHSGPKLEDCFEEQTERSLVLDLPFHLSREDTGELLIGLSNVADVPIDQEILDNLQITVGSTCVLGEMETVPAQTRCSYSGVGDERQITEANKELTRCSKSLPEQTYDSLWALPMPDLLVDEEIQKLSIGIACEEMLEGKSIDVTAILLVKGIGHPHS